MHRIVIILSVITACVFCTSTIHAQSFDYDKSPQFNYKFLDATIDLEVNPEEAGIAGWVKYRIESNLSNADTLSLQLAELQVDSVLVGAQKAQFDVLDNELRIAMIDSSVMGQQYEVQIFYKGSPKFGLLKSSEGSLWTSMLPLSNRHWVPVADHPGVSFTSTLSLTVPDQYVVVASGVKTDEERLSSGNKKITYRTGRPVPATAVGFAIGSFSEEGISYGIKRINSYAELNSITSDKQKMLVRQAENIIQQVENKTGLEYPFQRLHIIILNDHSWEQKPYGASTVFLYKNRGDFLYQLRRVIYAQWFGVYQHEVQWSNAWPMNFWQTVLHFGLSDTPIPLKNTDEPELNFSTVYDNFSIARWNFWQQYNTWDKPNLKQTARRIIPQILQAGSGSFTPEQYQDIWYRNSGQPTISVPTYPSATSSTTSASTDSIRYWVDYNLSTGTQNLQLIFTAQQGVINESVSIPVQIISGGAANASTISFSGSTDTVSVSLPAGTQNIRLDTPSGQMLVLDERKPVPFLLYQLRNAETTKARRQAAEQLGYHADNPDLQLALNDFMDQPMQPEVEAALLRSFGKITNGATGTQKRFLEALDSKDAGIQAAALDVLNNYEGDAVTRQLRTFSENESNTELSNRALNIYLQRVDSTAALQFTNTLVQQDTAGTKAIEAIAALGESGNTVKAVELANFYIAPVYTYMVRKKAFEILLNYDTSVQAWNERVEMLMSDRDPRIRFLTVENMGAIPGVDKAAILQQYKPTEYDARVFQIMSRE